MNRLSASVCALATLALGAPTFAQSVVSEPVGFQGRLTNPNGTPVPDATYQLTFSIYSAATGGTLLWQQVNTPVTVRNGTFTAKLSFTTGFQNGSTLDSTFRLAAPYLEIKIGTDAPLAPRQKFTNNIYALFANTANTVPDGSITNAKLAGGITADKFAANIFNPLAWLLNGNSGTSGTQFLGTTDNQPLLFKVNNKRAMQYQYAATNAFSSINVLGGSELNTIGAGVEGATIAGGGQDNVTGTDFPNSVTADFGAVGGGRGNTAGGAYAAVSGGNQNTASGFSAAVGGGTSNTADGDYAAIPGGNANTATGFAAAVGGGAQNTALGNYSFAAGRQAKANHNGTFVWADNTAADFASTSTGQFLIRAGGGVGINTNDPAGNALNIVGTAQMTGFQLPTGAGANKILTSDASGNGTWTVPTWQLNGTTLYNDTAAHTVIGSATLNNPYSFSRAFNIVSGSAGSFPGSTGIVVTDSVHSRSWSAGINTDGNFAFNKFGTGSGNVVVPVLQITGGSDVAEPFDVSGEVRPGMVVSIDPEKVGDLRLSSQAYDSAVAGVVSGAGGVKPGITLTQEGTNASGKYPVAMTGRVWCWCDADANGAITPGSLLTTSPTPGHAMRATDAARSHGAVIGKAMSSLKSGKGLVLVLVRPQ